MPISIYPDATQALPEELTLSHFLRTANNHENKALKEFKEPLKILGGIDALYMDITKEPGGANPPVSGVLFLNAHASWRAAIRLALSGQILPTFMTLRGSIESALYANAMVVNPTLQNIWIERDKSEKSRNECRKEFTAKKMFKYLSEAHDQEFSKHIENIYNSTIDFGAHPNTRSILARTKIDEHKEHYALNFTYIKAIGTFELSQALVACAEIGISAFSICLACFKSHPTIEHFYQRITSAIDTVPLLIRAFDLKENS